MHQQSHKRTDARVLREPVAVIRFRRSPLAKALSKPGRRPHRDGRGRAVDGPAARARTRPLEGDTATGAVFA